MARVVPAKEPIVCYETDDGESHVCVVDVAQSWLREGFLTSQMKFSLVNDGLQPSEHAVKTLGELVKSNGRAMPFLPLVESETVTMQTIQELMEEMKILNARNREVLTSIQSLRERTIAAHAEMLLISERIDKPSATLCDVEIQTTADMFDGMAEKPLMQRLEADELLTEPQPAPLHITTNNHQRIATQMSDEEALRSDAACIDKIEEEGDHHIGSPCVLAERPHHTHHPARTIDLSMMINPITEVLKPGGKVFEVQFAHQLTVEKLLRIDIGRVFPNDGIDPFQILRCFPSAEVVYQTSFEVKMRELLSINDEQRLLNLAGHLCLGKKIFCALCEFFISNDPSSLIVHIITAPHVEKMAQRHLMYPLEAIAFWMCVLRMSEKSAPWYHLNEKELHVVTAMIDKAEEPKSSDQETMKDEKRDQVSANECSDSSSFSTSDIVECLRKVQKVHKQTALPAQKTAQLTKSFNYALMKNPLAEIVRCEDTTLTAKRMELTSIERVLRIEHRRAYPCEGVDPFDVLLFFPDAVEEKVKPYATKLRKLFDGHDSIRFNVLTRHLFCEKTRNKILRCKLCEEDIKEKSADEIVKHISGKAHVSLMKNNDQLYPLASFAFWAYVLTMAEKGGVWFPPRQGPFPASPPTVSASDNEEDGSERPMGRIETNKPHAPHAILTKSRETPDPSWNLHIIVAYIERKLAHSVNIRRLLGDKTLRNRNRENWFLPCSVCPSLRPIEFTCPEEFIRHSVTYDHLNNILTKSGRVGMGYIFFWIDALSRASENLKQAISRPMSSLNRLLVAGIADPTSPVALLTHCRDVSDPCTDYGHAMRSLRRKYRKCNRAKFNETMVQYFGEELLCGICVEYDPIQSGRGFIKHVIAQNHIDNVIAQSGQVSQKAVQFWRDALYAATEAIPDQTEEEEVGTKKAAPAKVDEQKMNAEHSALGTLPLLVFPPKMIPYTILSAGGEEGIKMLGSISERFDQLRATFEQCDKQILENETGHLFVQSENNGSGHALEKRLVLVCRVCYTRIESSCNLVMHICSRNHIKKTRGEVSQEAFDYWNNAVRRAALLNEVPLPISVYKPAAKQKIEKKRKDEVTTKYNKMKQKERKAQRVKEWANIRRSLQST